MLISEKLQAHIIDTELSLHPSYVGKTMNIEITSKCNESCIYCQYAAKGFHKENKVIDDNLFYRVTKEARELGITDIGLYITAEPFMNPKLYDYTNYLKKELGFKYVYLSTNGIMCTPTNLVKLVEAGIDSIKFSVSSANRENFKKHHGIDAFDKVFENIKFAYEFRKDNRLDYKLYMFSILTRYNLQEKEEIINTYKPYIDEILFSNVISSPYVIGVEEYLGVDKKKLNIIEEINGKKLPCLQLFERIVINEDGYLCACCHETRTKYTQVENLNNMSLKEAIYGDNLVNLRKRHLEKDIKGIICENCIYDSIKKIEPLNNVFMHELINSEVIDITNEIKSRFRIE